MPRPTIHNSFDAYLEELALMLEYADRVPSFKDYCYGLMLPLTRKSIEPIALGILVPSGQVPAAALLRVE